MSFKDDVGASDYLQVGLASFMPPNNPCPECGQESKEANVHTKNVHGESVPVLGARICSGKECRHEFNVMN